MNEAIDPNHESGGIDASADPALAASADVTLDDARLEDEFEALEAAVALSIETTDADAAFIEALDPATRAFGETKPQAVVCQWCNGTLESAELTTCPHCGSLLRPVDENLVVPGVTTLSPDAARRLEIVEVQRQREAARRGEALYVAPTLEPSIGVVPAPDAATIDAALRPPDDEVRRLMREMELDAREAAAAAEARANLGARQAAATTDLTDPVEAPDATLPSPDAPDATA